MQLTEPLFNASETLVPFAPRGAREISSSGVAAWRMTGEQHAGKKSALNIGLSKAACVFVTFGKKNGGGFAEGVSASMLVFARIFNTAQRWLVAEPPVSPFPPGKYAFPVGAGCRYSHGGPVPPTGRGGRTARGRAGRGLGESSACRRRSPPLFPKLLRVARPFIWRRKNASRSILPPSCL